MSQKKYYKHSRKRQTKDSYSGVLVVFLILSVVLVHYRTSKTTQVELVVFLLVAVFITSGIVIYLWQKERRANYDLNYIDQMDGFDFEKYVKKLVQAQGFTQVRLTEKYDLGIDIVATKNNIRWGIQVKRNRGKVKALAVRQVVTALKRYKCDRAMVVTNSQFTNAAKELAKYNDCILIDRSRLLINKDYDKYKA